VTCSIMLWVFGTSRETFKSFGFGREYLHCCRGAGGNGFLRAHMGVMERIYCSVQIIFSSLSNF